MNDTLEEIRDKSTSALLGNPGSITSKLLLFMSMGWEEVSELRPPTRPLFILQMINMSMEPKWNDIDGEEPKNSDKNLSQCQFVHHNSHMD
jgi:hypothetical protein